MGEVDLSDFPPWTQGKHMKMCDITDKKKNGVAERRCRKNPSTVRCLAVKEREETEKAAAKKVWGGAIGLKVFSGGKGDNAGGCMMTRDPSITKS